MVAQDELKVLTPGELEHFLSLQPKAVEVVSARLLTAVASTKDYAATLDPVEVGGDLSFHLEFLRPVLEFGLLQPMVDYLHWYTSVQAARSVPVGFLMQSLDWLADFFDEAMNVDEGTVVAQAIRIARTKFLESSNAPTVALLAPEAWSQATAFESVLLAGRQRDALGIVNRCLDEGHSLIQVQLHVIQPALYNIGEKWQTNHVTVAQEHMATAIVESVMTLALLRSPPPVPNGKRVVLACVEGNNHSIGLRMVADSFLLSGWEIEYLGANVPTRALVQQVTNWKPALVGLSASFAQQLGTVKTVIAALAESLGTARPAVLVGGLAINRFNRLAAAVGADGSGADAIMAVNSANAVLSRKGA